MNRTDMLQGIRIMKFEDIYERAQAGSLSRSEAALVLGMSERTFRRWRVRYETDGVEGLYDRRLGQAASNRVSLWRYTCPSTIACSP